MRKLTADWVLPVTSEPMKEGVILCDNDGTIVEITDRKTAGEKHLEVFHGALCPGFINAHCHLELSYLKGKIESGRGLDSFIGDITQIRDQFGNEEKVKSARKADKEMKRNGIVAVGDISNSAVSFSIKKDSELFYHTFIELFGVHPTVAFTAFSNGMELSKKAIHAEIPFSITPHAPYSVSEQLLSYIDEYSENEPNIISVHHLESQEELAMFVSGKGKILNRLKTFGIDFSGWEMPNMRPLEWLLPRINSAKKILLVHNTFMNRSDFEIIESEKGKSEIFLCLCPAANFYIEKQLPDILLLSESGLPICLGTDSLASNHHLSILDEMRVLSLTYPEIPFYDILAWATINGAKFLGIDSWAGSFEADKKPGINLIKGVRDPFGMLSARTTIKRIL